MGDVETARIADWTLPATFGTALGTTLLALTTGLLALVKLRNVGLGAALRVRVTATYIDATEVGGAMARRRLEGAEWEESGL